MTIPDYQTLMRPVLEVAAQQDEWPMRDLVEAVAPVVGVSAADRTETISSGMGLWENRTQWAVTYLVKAGALRRPRRAVVQVTDRGRQLLASGSAVDNKALGAVPGVPRLSDARPAQPGGSGHTRSGPLAVRPA
jgi:restriction system protein